jgi:SAM-dependent methyltransferase
MMKGLFMSEFESTTDKSKCLWNELADTWDERMGENNNRFHNEIIKPSTIKLLEIKENDRLLDIACGNGNFSRYMAELGVKVVAFDYSEKMIENAQIRCRDFLSQIDFRVVDATKYNEVISLGKHGLFDKAVSNMAVMDISDIQPLFKAAAELREVVVALRVFRLVCIYRVLPELLKVGSAHFLKLFFAGEDIHRELLVVFDVHLIELVEHGDVL